MDDRFLNNLIRSLLGSLLVLAAGVGLQAQCEGPFNLACQDEINIALRPNCQLEVTPQMVLTNLANCLADSNFTILVEDAVEGNGQIVDGPGRFRYVITGQNHPELTDFTCGGFVNVVDATPPAIQISSGPIDRGCNLRTLADINLLPVDVPHCYIVDGATAQPIPETLDGRLAQALLAGGGIPTVFDACGGDVEVCINDTFDVGPGNNCVDTINLQRSFIATDLDGNPNFAPAFRAQNIRFIRPQISDLRNVPEAIFISCENNPQISVNPLPRNSDYPFFEGNAGPVFLNENFCNYGLDYIDGPRILGCGNNYGFVRSYRLFDWCRGGLDTLFTQIVRVGDRQGPEITVPQQDLDFNGIPDVGPLQFSTNTGLCTAFINVGTGATATDDCAEQLTLEAFIYLNQDLGSVALGPYRLAGSNTNPLTDQLPVGTHLLRYIGQDPCNNTTTSDVSIVISDGNAPQAVCENGFSISLDGSGLAVLQATAIGANSNDGCGPVDLLVARVNGEDFPITVPDERVIFTCGDLGQQRIVMIAVDQQGNENRCWTEVLVEDKSAPICIPPGTIGLHCLLFSESFPLELAEAFDANPEGIGAQLNASFGAATGTDNCSVSSMSQDISGELGNCGTGQFTRTFTITDAEGFVQQDVCPQVINILPYSEYSIRFPGDSNYECGELPTPEDLIGTSSGCELLSVNTIQDTLTTIEPGNCYALRLTYEVINWCEYDGQSLPVTLPRDADGNGDFSEPLFLNVTAITPGTLNDDRAVLDRDRIVGNGNDLGQLFDNYGTSPRRGHFRYRQFVGIFDSQPPSLEIPEPEDGLAFTDNCLGGVIVNFTAVDECGKTSTTVTIDEFVSDRDGDGSFTDADFAGEYDIPESRYEGEPETGVEVPVRNLGIGQHMARVQTTDGCGNTTTVHVILTVTDGRPPSPVCIGVLSVNLAPDADAGGINTVWATDYVASPAVTCTETAITYSLYTEEEAAVPGFVPQQNHFNINVDCANLGETVLRLYAFAESTGLNSFCNVVLNVTDIGSLCNGRMGQITGLILDGNGDPMQGVEVFNNGTISQVTFSEDNGSFLFDGLEEGVDYTVQPYLDVNPINGVSTGDLNVIGRLLLTIDEDLSPYQLIAADANNNGAITILDLVMIREVILGIEDDFDNNNSWRFILKDYVFPDPEDPWQEDFPEVASFNNLTGTEFVEFVAIKVGDVTGNADPHDGFWLGGESEVNGRSASSLVLKEQEQGIWALHAGAGEGLTAVQASLQLPVGAQLLPGQVSPAEYRLGKDNILRLSHVSTDQQISPEKPLLRFRIKDSGKLPTLSQRPQDLRCEGYTADFKTLSLRLHVEHLSPAETPIAVSLTVSPNPSRAEARVSASWPTTEEVTIVVYDARGRVVGQKMTTAIAGDNQWVLSSANFGDAPGVYLLHVRGNTGGEVVRRMIRE